jgi:methanogenic corrinoid protein MtbC1
VTPGDAYRGYVDALGAGDRHQAFAAVEAAVDAGLDLRTIYLEVFQPALGEVGRWWEEGTFTVAQEHLATAITQTAMGRLAGHFFFKAPTGGPSLLGACVGTERHALGLRMICDLLEVEGWTTTYLGSTVPSEDLVRLILDRRPQVVALSAALAPHLLPLRATLEALRSQVRPCPLLIVGGRAFGGDAERARTVGADLTAADAAEAVVRLKERLA